MGMSKNNVQAMKCCLINGKFALLLLSSIFLFTSCGNGLSRGKAEKIIKNYYQYPICEVEEYFNYSIYAHKEEQLKNIIQNGLIEKTPVNIGWNNYADQYVITEKGKKFVLGDVSPYCQQKVVTNCIIFDKIRGVQVNEQNKTASVDFTCKRIGITPFGQDLGYKQDDILYFMTNLVLYDDGWRVANNMVAVRGEYRQIGNKFHSKATDFSFFNEKGEYIGVK